MIRGFRDIASTYLSSLSTSPAGNIGGVSIDGRGNSTLDTFAIGACVGLAQFGHALGTG